MLLYTPTAPLVSASTAKSVRNCGFVLPSYYVCCDCFYFSNSLCTCPPFIVYSATGLSTSIFYLGLSVSTITGDTCGDVLVATLPAAREHVYTCYESGSCIVDCVYTNIDSLTMTGSTKVLCM